MPGFAAHALLAHRTLAAWSECGGAPFPPRDPRCQSAFLNGAVGPDMGLFSRHDDLISDLAHYVRSGDLCRALVRAAEDELQAAFAWGWVSHVLADAQIHALINRAVGEWLTGDRERAISYADDPAAHVRIEMGLDAFCFGQLGPAEPSTFESALDARTVGFVAAAFDATYGPGVVRSAELLRANHICARYSHGIRKLNTVHDRARRGRRIPAGCWPFFWTVYLPSKWLSKLRPSGLTYAACHPAPLPDWLGEEFCVRAARFAGEFLGHVETKLANLLNYNLDLGYEESAADPYPLTSATLAQLGARRQQVGAAFASEEAPTA